MKKTERKIYTRCMAVMAVYIIAAVYFYTLPVSAKNVAYADDGGVGEYFIDDSSKSRKNALFDENSAMPCVDREAFERWYAEYEAQHISNTSNTLDALKGALNEQETGEEEEVESDFLPDSREDVPQEVPTVQSSEVETSAEVESGSSEEVCVDCLFYAVNGETLNPELQAKLHDALERHGISYFWEIALAQCYQESRFDVYAVNQRNLKDMGILQYRKDFWDWTRGDIFSVDAQFELYAEQMANRLNAGLSADECISRHKTSDYCAQVDWEYVSQVKQWINTVREVKQ